MALTKLQGFLLLVLVLSTFLVLNMAYKIIPQSGDNWHATPFFFNFFAAQPATPATPSPSQDSFQGFMEPVGNVTISFPPVPKKALECNKDKFFYAAGVEGKQCVDQCPAPTLPDVKGHCKAGQHMR